MIEFLFEIVGEFLLQFVFEAVASVFGRTDSDGKPAHPFVKFMGYAIFGGVAGGLSLLIVPHLLVQSPGMRIANLVITPLLAGGMMALVGKWREKHDRKRSPIDRFAYGYCFALTMALVRFHFGSTAS